MTIMDRAMGTNVPFRERISCTVDEACSATGLGRAKLYEEIAAGRVEVRKVGRRTLVLVPSLERLVVKPPDERVSNTHAEDAV
jgi:excisionase family DNA binding protein